MAGGVGGGHELPPYFEFVEDALTPRRVEPRRVVGFAVFVGVDLDRIAVNIRFQPGLSGEKVVEEAAIVHQLVIEDFPIGPARLVFGDVWLGEVEAITAGPHFNLVPFGVVQVIVVGQALVLDRVDGGEHQDLRIALAQCADVAGSHFRAQVDVHLGGEVITVAQHVARSPQIRLAREVRIGGGKGAVQEPQRVVRRVGAAHIDLVGLARIAGQSLHPAFERGHCVKRRIRIHRVAASGRDWGFHSEVERGGSRRQERARWLRIANRNAGPGEGWEGTIPAQRREIVAIGQVSRRQPHFTWLGAVLPRGVGFHFVHVERPVPDRGVADLVGGSVESELRPRGLGGPEVVFVAVRGEDAIDVELHPAGRCGPCRREMMPLARLP